jgi:hypothetical protein
MPYPCSGPIESRVVSAIRARVPCQTSAFGAPGLIWETNMRIRMGTFRIKSKVRSQKLEVSE